MEEPIIHIENISKTFGAVEALRTVSLDVSKGEVVVIIGPSGSGKSTLLRCINRLEEFDAGKIIVDGIPLDTAENINAVRTEVGMVFQQFNLFPHLTVLQNIMLAQQVVRKRGKNEAEAKAMQLLVKVGIPDKANAYPHQLSGGQQQRVAVARALVAEPELILADEPTGNLDSRSADEIAMLLRQVANEWGRAVLMVTHDAHVASYADRILFLKDGAVLFDENRPESEAPGSTQWVSSLVQQVS